MAAYNGGYTRFGFDEETPNNWTDAGNSYMGPGIASNMQSFGMNGSPYSALTPQGQANPFAGTLAMNPGATDTNNFSAWESQFQNPSGGSAAGGQTPIIGSSSLAPTRAQVSANPLQYAGTSFDPSRSALQGGQQSYDPNWQPLLTPYNTSNPSQANDPLAWVRNLDQVTYQKYILPYQMRGGNLQDIPAMQKAIQDGMAAAGGGQWASGSQVNNVSGPVQSWMTNPQGNASNYPGTPGGSSGSSGGPPGESVSQAAHRMFLAGSDPRAAYLRNLMASGSALEKQSAQTWLNQNITPEGTAGNALDSMDAWTGRFRKHFLGEPNTFGGSSTTTGGGGGGSTLSSGQQAITYGNMGDPGTGDYSDWYASNTGPGYHGGDITGYQQWSQSIDQQLLAQLPYQFRNASQAQLQDDNFLRNLRTQLDNLRTQNGLPTYQQAAQYGTASAGPNNDWLYEQSDLQNAPFAPTENPGNNFKWDFVQSGPNDPGRWVRKAKEATTYQEYLQQIEEANQLSAQNKIPILGGSSLLGLMGEQYDPFSKVVNGQRTPIAEALYNLNKQYTNPNTKAYDFGINKQFENQFNEGYDPYNSDSLASFTDQLNQLRSQWGYNNIGQLGSTSPVTDPSWYAGSTAGTPYRPTEAPLEGFKWNFVDPDGAGGLTQKTWMMQQAYNPTTLADANSFAQKLSGYASNPNFNKLQWDTNMFGSSKNGNNWSFAVNPNYPTWKPAATTTSSQSTPQFSFPTSNQNPTYTQSGGGSGSTGTGTPSPSFTSPFGSLTSRPTRAGSSTNYYG